MRTRASAMLVGAALLGATACAGAVTDETQAYSLADQHICRAVAALDVEVGLGLGYRNSVPMKGLTGTKGSQVQVGVAYSVELPPVQGDVFERNRGIFQRLKARWEADGYRVVRHDVRGPFTVLNVVDPRDDFSVTLKQGKTGNLSLTAGSPWVTATGVEPSQEPPDCRNVRAG